MSNLERDYFDKIEDIFAQVQAMKDVINILLTDCFEFRVEALEQKELKENYIKGQIIINAIFDLLCYQTEETREFISKQIESH